MSTLAIPRPAQYGASLGLSADEIEAMTQLSADLSDEQILLLHHVSDIYSPEERIALVTPAAAPTDESDLLSLEGVAALLNIPAAQVLDLTAHGELLTSLNVPGVGQRWYAPAIHKWIAAQPSA